MESTSFEDHISNAATMLDCCYQTAGDEGVAALEAVVISNMLRRYHGHPTHGVLSLLHLCESMLGPLGLTFSPTGEGGYPILHELPEGMDRIMVGGRVFTAATALA